VVSRSPLAPAALPGPLLWPPGSREAITKEAAERLAGVADRLRGRGLDPHQVARFLDRIVFCLFAEDVGLLPDGTLTQVLGEFRFDPDQFTAAVRELFEKMAAGGRFGVRRIKHFDGNLFENVEVLALDHPEIESIWLAGKLDWSAVDASIFGTLFERGMDPAKRAQLGAHYTSRADIETLVEPAVMAPLRREWDDARGTIECLLTTGKKTSHAEAAERGGEREDAEKRESGSEIGNRQSQIENAKGLFAPATEKTTGEAALLINRFLTRLSKVHVLDPACGSGNLLYVTLQRLKDLEKEAILYAAERGLGDFAPAVGPWQLHGIEISEYAFELAQLTVWIGHLQWLIHNGFGHPAEPILRPMHTFECKDAILQFCPAGSTRTDTDRHGQLPPVEDSTRPCVSVTVRVASAQPQSDGSTQEMPPEGGTTNSEPEWPRVDFLVGNPPFLGGNKIRQELGDEYVDALFEVYQGRVPPFADLCCYWFEKARKQIEEGKAQRAGLLATQGIRGGANREVLKRIKATGSIFFAESDRPWVLEGANVHVSMVAFDAGAERTKVLDGRSVPSINPNLTAVADITTARVLRANSSISFMGPSAKAPLDIPEKMALQMLNQGGNVHGLPNSDVIRRVASAVDLVKKDRFVWTIDFASMDEATASPYEAPSEHARKTVYPLRARNPRQTNVEWWQHERPRVDMRKALTGLGRFLSTPGVSKHRIFVWRGHETLCNQGTLVFARSDDYFFGVLHSRLHEVWPRAQATQLRERESGLRYTPTTCFETFPFPWPGEVARRSAAEGVGRVSDAEAGLRPGGAGYDAAEAHVAAIAEATRELNALRENWLNPPEWVKEEVLEFPGTVGRPWSRYIVDVAQRPSAESAQPRAAVPQGKPRIGLVRYPRLVPRDVACAERLRKRTLTALYNQRPTWLALAHRKLDEAVFAAYGWDPGLSDEEILEKLLALNLERAAAEG